MSVLGRRIIATSLFCATLAVLLFGYHRGMHVAGPTAAAISDRIQQQVTRQQATTTKLLVAWKTAISSYDGSVDIAVENLSTKQVVHYSNTNSTFATASIVKLAIAEKVLLDNQVNGQSLSATQRAELTSMLEDSDNEAATALWKSIGGTTAMDSFYQKIGASNTKSGSLDYWGLTTTTAADQLKILEVLNEPGKTLAEDSIATIHGLLGNVEADQSWGIGAGTPNGTTVRLKDGWLDDAEIAESRYTSTNDWLINSTGYVQQGSTTYAITILTDGNATEAGGINTVESLATVTWQILL